MASRSLGTLTLDLVAKTGGFREGMTAAERQAEKTNQKIRRETAATIDAVAAFGAKTVLVASAVTVALAGMGVQAIDAIGRQADLAKQLGVTVNELNQVARAADLSGVEFEMLASNMKRMNNVIGEAQAGNKTAIETLARLGTTAADVARMNLPDRIDLLSEAMDGLSTQTEKAALLQDLFGKAGQEMLPLLTEQGKSMRIAADEMQRFGVAMNQFDIEKIEQAGDDISSMKFAVQGLGNQLAVSFAPVVSVFSERILDATGNVRGFGDAALIAFRTVAQAGAVAYTPVSSLLDLINALQTAALGAATAFAGMRSVIRDIGIRPEEEKKEARQLYEDLKTTWMRAGADFRKGLDAPLPLTQVNNFFDEVEKRARERPIQMPVVTMSYDGMNTVGPASATPESSGASAGGVEVVDMQTALEEQSAIMEQYRSDQMAADQFVHERKMAMFADEIAAETANSEAMADLQRKVTEDKAKEYQKNADFFQKGLDAIARGNSKASKVARALNLADTLFTIALQTKVAAINAYAFGSKLGGPVLGAAFAGVAIAFGSAMASEAIAGSRGGSSGGGVPTAGVTTPDVPALADGQATAGRQAPPVEVTIVGEGMPSWQQVAEIMNMVGERMADSGGRMGKVTILTA